MRAFSTFLLALILSVIGAAGVLAQTDQHIFDNANLLTEPEKVQLEQFAADYSRESEVDFLFLTTTSTEGQAITGYMGDFFDDWAVDNNQEDAVLLTIDMGNREVYLAGFGTAEARLDDQRIQRVLDRIMPYMAAADYGGAFEEAVTTSSRYMEFRPGVNPDSLFFNNWLHILLALVIGGAVVGTMAFTMGGRVTTTSRTYFDENNTQVKSRRDRFRNKTVTRRKVPKNNTKGGGGFGGGGMTGGGRSFSGGGRKF
ncbi:MAG TPA: TPM domain-containing protein [Planococcus sp. (in: firmicutes)]|nr:TPM domain-containing protein [Planococcus sp. (in: firmicutes)]